jgi:hypothetical protein
MREVGAIDIPEPYERPLVTLNALNPDMVKLNVPGVTDGEVDAEALPQRGRAKVGAFPRSPDQAGK